jgi:hypothetical protein
VLNLSGKQWLIVIAVVLLGVALQVAWILLRPEPVKHGAAAAPASPATQGR